MPQTGKCPNYAGCLTAYRNELLEVPDGAPFVCPECKHALSPSGSPGVGTRINFPLIIIGGISLLVIMGAGAVYIRAQHIRDSTNPGQIGTSFEQAQVAAEHGEFMPSRHMSIATPSPAAANQSQAPATTPPDTNSPADTTTSTEPTGVQAQAPNLDLQDEQNQRVKRDVLQRIDLMPTITSEDKDKLYMSVERARQMGKILTIPFPSGHTTVSATDIDQLKAALASAQLQPLTKDPTCVFVVLGFADMKGDEKANLHISTERAQSVLAAMRDKCAVLNVMHSVGMGGSTLFNNQKDTDRNRVAEVWAVLP